VNDHANVTPDRRRVVVDLSEALDPSQLDLRVVRQGRKIVLEPADAPREIAAGYYSSETLPPLSAGAKAILASVDAAVARLRASKSAEDEALEIEDPAVAIGLADEPLPGIDPGD
jgi:hypothetical protein